MYLLLILSVTECMATMTSTSTGRRLTTCGWSGSPSASTSTTTTAPWSSTSTAPRYPPGGLSLADIWSRDHNAPLWLVRVPGRGSRWSCRRAGRRRRWWCGWAATTSTTPRSSGRLWTSTCGTGQRSPLELETKVKRRFTITEKAPSKA